MTNNKNFEKVYDYVVGVAGAIKNWPLNDNEQDVEHNFCYSITLQKSSFEQKIRVHISLDALLHMAQERGWKLTISHHELENWSHLECTDTNGVEWCACGSASQMEKYADLVKEVTL